MPAACTGSIVHCNNHPAVCLNGASPRYRVDPARAGATAKRDIAAGRGSRDVPDAGPQFRKDRAACAQDTAEMARATASRLLWLRAATQMRPESTP